MQGAIHALATCTFILGLVHQGQTEGRPHRGRHDILFVVLALGKYE